jgi:hypothetical protein
MSKNWEKRFLTPEEVAEMENVFNERFFSFIKRDENIFIEGGCEEEVLYITLILKNTDESFYYPFETSISKNDNPNLNFEDAKSILLDFIGAYFEQYFSSDRDTFISIVWSEFNCEGIKFYARGQVVNKKAEDLADNFLKEKGYNDKGDKNGGND